MSHRHVFSLSDTGFLGLIAVSAAPAFVPFSPPPKAYYRMESIGGTLIDSVSGNLYPLTVTGTGASVSAGGKIGNKLDLLNSGNFHISNDTVLTPDPDFTIAFWAFVTDATINSVFFIQAATAFNRNISICAKPAGAGKFKICEDGDTAFQLYPFYDTTTFNANEWNYFALKTTSAGAISISANGAPWSLIYAAGVPNYQNPLIVGSNHVFTGDRLTGSLDEMAVWNTALTDAKLLEAYTRGTLGQSLT